MRQSLRFVTSMIVCAMTLVVAEGCSQPQWAKDNDRRMALVERARHTNELAARVRLLIQALDGETPLGWAAQSAEQEALSDLLEVGKQILPELRIALERCSPTQLRFIGLLMARIGSREGFTVLCRSINGEMRLGGSGHNALGTLLAVFEVDEEVILPSREPDLKALADWERDSLPYVRWAPDQRKFSVDEDARASKRPTSD